MKIRSLPGQFSPRETAVVLRGFVENGVTYESHTFFVEYGRDGYRSGPEAMIYCLNGSGWSALPVRHMIAGALSALIATGREREAFKLCWELFEKVREARSSVWAEMKIAFLQGRLKKRRVRGGTRENPRYEVYIEETHPQSNAA